MSCAKTSPSVHQTYKISKRKQKKTGGDRCFYEGAKENNHLPWVLDGKRACGWVTGFRNRNKGIRRRGFLMNIYGQTCVFICVQGIERRRDREVRRDRHLEKERYIER